MAANPSAQSEAERAAQSLDRGKRVRFKPGDGVGAIRATAAEAGIELDDVDAQRAAVELLRGNHVLMEITNGEAMFTTSVYMTVDRFVRHLSRRPDCRTLAARTGTHSRAPRTAAVRTRGSRRCTASRSAGGGADPDGETAPGGARQLTTETGATA